MNLLVQQKPIEELLNELSEKLNEFLRDSYIVKVQEKSGLSQPVISALKRKRFDGNVTGMTLKTLLKIANAIGYTVEIKLEKINETEVTASQKVS